MRTQLHIFPTFAMGGAQRRFLQIAGGVPGWHHHVVSLNDDLSATSAAGHLDLTAERLDLKKTAAVSLSNLMALRQLVERVDPTILCTYNWGSMEACFGNRFIFRRPHIHFEDGFGPDEAMGTLPRRDRFRRMALGRSTRIVVPSLGLKAITRDKWARHPENIRFIVNGVDTERFRPAVETKPSGAPQRIGFVGALRQEKNIARLIDAVSKAEEAPQLLIVGQGDERTALEHQVKSVGIDAVFSGNVDDPAETYHDFDVFALTSNTEQMPLTVLEAMASGLPVVATDVGDIRHMVSEENREFIVPLSDAQTALPKAIDTLLQNAALRATIGNANRRKAVATYSLDQMFTAYAELFREVLPSEIKE